ncbi:hypothetical protein [Chryseobacterium angstadtii]|nr:hypothetical protein [Chryseobacterium angstadtii]
MKFKILALTLSLFLLNCSKEKSKSKRLPFSVDKNLKNNPVFKKMESENEIQMGIDSEPPKSKKTTQLIFNISSEYICEPVFWKNTDTLNVNIVNHSGFSSGGFNIQIHDGTYEVSPYHISDDLADNEKSSTFKNPKQKLILNQAVYRPNDSIYGYVEFEKTEYDSYGNIIPHKGKGYFRGKIEYVK